MNRTPPLLGARIPKDHVKVCARGPLAAPWRPTSAFCLRNITIAEMPTINPEAKSGSAVVVCADRRFKTESRTKASLAVAATSPTYDHDMY